MTSPDRRLNADQIKSHPFFYGVDWDSIRRIDSPFVPNLRSITDTSYFPTDEIDQSPVEVPAASAGGAQKDLAFLGCVDKISSKDLAEIAAQIYLQEVYYLFSCFLNCRLAGVCRSEYQDDKKCCTIQVPWNISSEAVTYWNMRS